MEGMKLDELAQPAKDAVAYLRGLETDGIILGCTEIPLLLESEQPDIINPSQLLAEAAIRYAIE
jgi:aspartate/glutamate racemase